MLPLISIIIPIYNIESFLNKCLDSIVSQTYPNYEVLLINDGSTDASEEICREYVKKYNQFQLYTKENNGVSNARNEGIKKAHGEYITFIDGDDYIENNYIEMLYKPFNYYDIDLSICGYIKENTNGDIIYKIDDKDNYLSERKATILSLFGKDKYYRYQGYIYNKLYKKSIIDEYNIKFYNEIFFNEDRLFAFQYILHTNKAHYTTIPLYHYIIHNNSAVFSAIESTTKINKYLTFIDAFIIMDNNIKDDIDLKKTIRNNLVSDLIQTYELFYNKNINQYNHYIISLARKYTNYSSSYTHKIFIFSPKLYMSFIKLRKKISSLKHMINEYKQ